MAPRPWTCQHTQREFQGNAVPGECGRGGERVLRMVIDDGIDENGGQAVESLVHPCLSIPGGVVGCLTDLSAAPDPPGLTLECGIRHTVQQGSDVSMTRYEFLQLIWIGNDWPDAGVEISG